MGLFESKKERDERIEQEKLDIQIKTDMKVRQLEKMISQNDKEAQDHLLKAEKFRAAGNKDAAMDAYQDYQFSRSMRRTVNKSVRMMKQVATMVKTGNLTNDVFVLLKDGMESSQFEPGAIQKVIAGNERLKQTFEYVNDAMETASSGSMDELNAETWYNSANSTADNPVSTNDLDKMAAEFEKVKRG